MNYRLTPKMKSAAKKILIFVYIPHSTHNFTNSQNKLDWAARTCPNTNQTRCH
jgi:hypothetical protein